MFVIITVLVLACDHSSVFQQRTDEGNAYVINLVSVLTSIWVQQRKKHHQRDDLFKPLALYKNL